MAEIEECAVLTLLSPQGLPEWYVGIEYLGQQFCQPLSEVRQINGSIFYGLVVYAQQRVIIIVVGTLHIQQSHALLPLVLEY